MELIIIGTLIAWFFGSCIPTIAHSEAKNGREMVCRQTTFSSIAYSLYIAVAMPAWVGTAYRLDEPMYKALFTFFVLDALISKTTLPIMWWSLTQALRGVKNVLRNVLANACNFILNKMDYTAESILSWYLKEEKREKRRAEF